MGFAIGVDVGSQSVKGVLLDGDGRVCAEAGSPVSIVHPAPAWAEQDPRSWETGLAAVVGALLYDAGVAPDQVSALALACQVDSVVPVDEAGEPLDSAIIWLDRRATRQSAQLSQAVGETELIARTGLNPDASHTAPKDMWLRDEEPEHYRAARWLADTGLPLTAVPAGESISV